MVARLRCGARVAKAYRGLEKDSYTFTTQTIISISVVRSSAQDRRKEVQGLDS